MNSNPETPSRNKKGILQVLAPPAPRLSPLRCLLPTACCLLLLLAAPSTRAANGTWTGTTNSTWSTGTNWSGGTPGAANSRNNLNLESVTVAGNVRG